MYIHFSLEDSNAILRNLKFDRPFVVNLKIFGIKNPITFSRIIKEIIFRDSSATIEMNC
jgi:hypothetical protein